VKSQPESLELQLNYAGVTQVVDLHTRKVLKRRARLLDRAAEFDVTDKATCPSERWLYLEDGTVVTFACNRTQPLVTPYLSGKFAKQGYAFIVVRVESFLAQIAMYDQVGSRALYKVTKAKGDIRLDGREPIKAIEEKSQIGAINGYYAWRVELDEDGDVPMRGPLRFEGTYKLELHHLTGDLDPEKRRKVTIEGDIPLHF
jgi:hypothetical protein